jgi:hypothetical protein
MRHISTVGKRAEFLDLGSVRRLGVIVSQERRDQNARKNSSAGCVEAEDRKTLVLRLDHCAITCLSSPLAAVSKLAGWFYMGCAVSFCLPLAISGSMTSLSDCSAAPHGLLSLLLRAYE